MMNSAMTNDELLEYAKKLKISRTQYQDVEVQFTTRILYQTSKDRGVCSHCGTLHYIDPSMVTKKGSTSMYSTFVCNACWSTCKVHKVRKNTNFTRNNERRYTRFIIKDGDTFVQVTFDTYMTPTVEGERFEYLPIEFRFLNGKSIRTISWGYDHWISRKCNISFGGYYNSQFAYGYPDWDEVLEDTDLKYSQFGEYMNWRTSKEENESVLEMFVILRKYPMLEMVWKMGLKTLYQDFIKDHSGKRETVKALHDHRKVVVSRNPSMAQIQSAIELIRNYKMPLDTALDYNHERRNHPSHYLTYTNGIADDLKVIKYVLKNDQKNYYKDYLSMLQQIGTPVDKSTIFPKDITKAHDDATMKFNTLKYEKDDRKYVTRLTELKTLEIASNSLCIIVPEKMGEILQEGKALHHCVGSYVDKVIKDETTILFIRKTNDKETPYYTMEWKNGKIVQIRGLHNIDATPEVKDFTDEWLKWTKKKPKKTKQPVMQLQAVNA